MLNIGQKLLVVGLSISMIGCTAWQKPVFKPVPVDPAFLQIPHETNKPHLRKAPHASPVTRPGPLAQVESDLLPPPPPLQPGETDIGKAVAIIKKAQVAPFTGVLLSPAAAATVIAEIKNQDAKCAIEIQKKLDELKVQSDLKYKQLEISYNTFKSSCEIKIKSRDDTIDLLNRTLEKNTNPKTELWFIGGLTGGFLVGVGLTVATVFALSKTME